MTKLRRLHAGLSHYRVLISALFRQYQLLAADRSEGIHFGSCRARVQV